MGKNIIVDNFDVYNEWGDEHEIEKCVKFDDYNYIIDQMHEDGDEHMHVSKHSNMI